MNEEWMNVRKKSLLEEKESKEYKANGYCGIATRCLRALNFLVLYKDAGRKSIKCQIYMHDIREFFSSL